MQAQDLQLIIACD